jgi:hypothetical protein
MIKMLDIIKEGSYDAQGVGDKAYEKFFIPTDTENIKVLRDLQKQEEKPVGRVKDVDIYLNPKSVAKFGTNVRAIGDIQGNLYVPQRDGNFIHWDIADALKIDLYSPETVRMMRLGRSDIFVNLSDFDDDYTRNIIKTLQHRNSQFQFRARY